MFFFGRLGNALSCTLVKGGILIFNVVHLRPQEETLSKW